MNKTIAVSEINFSGEPVNEEGYVLCVCGCKQPTQVKAGTPVDMRPFDVDGAGTLRKECWERIYG